MDAMAPSEPLAVVPQAEPQIAGTCGECGAIIGSVTLHTEWHAGADRADDRQAILLFLESVDPGELSQAALNLNPDGDPIGNALQVLRDLAARA